MLLASSLSAQRRYESVLRQVEENNPMLKAARQQSEAQQLEAHVGLMLPDPEVDLTLFRGFPAEQGTRWDLRVSQSFEMPSVYVRRARLRNLREHAAELDYETIRNALLHEAQLVCAEYIYNRAIYSVYDKRLVTCYKLVALYEKRLQQGDCSVLDYNRVKVELAETDNLATHVLLRAGHLYRELCTLAGVESYDFRQETFDTVILPLMFNEWYDTVEMRNPQLRILQNQDDTRQQELQLSRSQWLPSMSVGYASETVTGAAFRGVTVGMTLPVWSQPRAVRQAKVSRMASQQTLTARRGQTYNETQCLMHHLFALQNNLNNMRAAYEGHNSLDLLEKAFEKGEISLEQYLIQMEHCTQLELAIWEVAYEMERGCIDLYAITL